MQALRQYQTEIVDRILQSFEVFNKVMLQMPTGTGKTTVFSEVVRKFIKEKAPNKRVLILVHRRELVFQIRERLEHFGFKPAFILSGQESSPLSQIQIANVQTIVKKNTPLQNISLIVIDEAHHCEAKTYKSIIGLYNKQTIKILGVTATPIRLDGAGFSDSFDTLITSREIPHFIEEGYLCRFKHFSTRSVDLREVEIDFRTGDYENGALYKAMSEEKVMAHIVDSYVKHGQNRKGIVFAVNRKHAMLISERFNKAGIKAAYIDGKTKVCDREQIIKNFTDCKIQVLVNVNIFTEGFDCPDINVLQLARPTKSLVLYLQMAGRVLRPKRDGSEAIILDNAMLYEEHGLITKSREWNLSGIRNKQIAGNEEKDNQETSIRGLFIQEVRGIDMVEVKDILNKAGKKVFSLKGNKMLNVNIYQTNNGRLKNVFDMNFSIELPLDKLVDDILEQVRSALKKYKGSDSSLIHPNTLLMMEFFFHTRHSKLKNNTLEFSMNFMKTTKFRNEIMNILNKSLFEFELSQKSSLERITA